MVRAVGTGTKSDRRSPTITCLAAALIAAVGLVALVVPGSAHATRTSVIAYGTDDFIQAIHVNAAQTGGFADANQFYVHVSDVRLTKSDVYMPTGGALVDAEGIPLPLPELEDQIREIFSRILADDFPTDPDPELEEALRLIDLVWLAPLASAVLVLSTPGTEKRIEGERWLIIEEHAPDAPGFRAFRPCRPIRFVTQSPMRPVRAAGCPLPPYQSIIPPRLYLDAGAADDHVNLDLPTVPRATSYQMVSGGAGSDVLLGSATDDILVGNSGEDGIFGYGGNDEIWGGHLRTLAAAAFDNDILWGGTGRDVILGGWGKDVVAGGANSDNLRPWSDVVFNDWPGARLSVLTAAGISNNAALQGGPDSDVVIGGGGVDTMMGNEGRDTLQARESDMGDLDVIDTLVDCRGTALAESSDDEFVRRSPGDVVSNCRYEPQSPITEYWVQNWSESLIRFPWESWPSTTLP